MKYEPDMQIMFDVVGKSALVVFRGASYYLNGPYGSRGEAVRAGEELCRRMGWGVEGSDGGRNKP